MFCKDKDLIINGKAVLSPEQQIYKNMKDIEELQKQTKKVYRTTESLSSSDNTVLLSTVNCPESENNGWLLDTNANLFSITGNNGTYLLILYYTNVAARP